MKITSINKKEDQMKKLLLLSTILTLGTTTMANTNEIIRKGENHLYFKAGANVISRYSQYTGKNSQIIGNKKITDGKTDDFGYELAIEGTRNLNENFELGLGVAYQRNNNTSLYFNSKDERSSMSRYDSIPIYVTGKYNFNLFGNWRPYFKGNIGYSFNIKEENSIFATKGKPTLYKTKVDNGLYAGIGVGVEYNDFLIDLTYSVNYAKASLDGINQKDEKIKAQRFDYSRLILSVGYKFDF